MLELQRRDRIGSRCASPRIVMAQEHAPIVGDHVNDITHEIRPMASRNGQGNPAAYCILRQPTPTHLGKEMLQLARSVSGLYQSGAGPEIASMAGTKVRSSSATSAARLSTIWRNLSGPPIGY